MPLWTRSSTTRVAVELHSDDEDLRSSRSSSSSNSSSNSNSGTTGGADLGRRSHAGGGSSPPRSQGESPRGGRLASPRFPSVMQTQEEPEVPAPAAVWRQPNRFTSGTAPRAIMAPAARPLLMGPVSPAHATIQRALSAQVPSARSACVSAIQTPRGFSARSSRGGGSFACAPQVLDRYNTMNILVLGGPQVGKSRFINAYRAAVTNSTRWPAAPVGISGFYGTTTVEPFPNHAREPTWLCIDTPGRLYTAEHEALLEKLTEGVPWKTRLLGPRALTLGEVEDLVPIAANKAHQCVLVVPATDLIEDEGWMSALAWRNRYRPAAGVAAIILYLKGLTSSLRALMNDASPFVVVSKMDHFGGAGCSGACSAIVSLLSQCVPVNRVYFTAAVENRALVAAGRSIVLESSTKHNLVRLHEDICLAVQWRNQMDTM
ncbi:hypothetical protein NESM_000798800 [Novymonas esmeraldas]|uniref:Uncharacterized protein n=1 Tax=Novymonas esmeraldas TaxID=1808958 RepID=A0AAW0EVW0_9TRYP